MTAAFMIAAVAVPVGTLIGMFIGRKAQITA